MSRRFKPFPGIILLFCFLSSAHSQPVDTVYYNYKWQICEKPFAEYYRYGLISSDSFWHYKGKVEDFYFGGHKQMEGAYSEKGRKEGIFIFYYPDGKVSAQGRYENGLINRFWNYYYPDGSKSAKVYYAGYETSFMFIDAFDSSGKATLKDGSGTFESEVVNLADNLHYHLTGEFLNGKRTGTWKYFVRQNGKISNHV
jgi:antitoxin component YwqK of YwqJK toxin-antitoxin module